MLAVVGIGKEWPSWAEVRARLPTRIRKCYGEDHGIFQKSQIRFCRQDSKQTFSSEVGKDLWRKFELSEWVSAHSLLGHFPPRAKSVYVWNRTDWTCILREKWREIDYRRKTWRGSRRRKAVIWESDPWAFRSAMEERPAKRRWNQKFCNGCEARHKEGRSKRIVQRTGELWNGTHKDHTISSDEQHLRATLDDLKILEPWREGERVEDFG